LGGSTELVSADRNAQTAEHTLASRSGFVNHRRFEGSTHDDATHHPLPAGPARGALAVPASGAAAQPSQAASAAASAGADFDNDGFADLAASAPAEDVGSVFNAGAVSAGGRLLTQNSPGVPGTAEDIDSFGGNSFNAG
jgi:FG-GAP repeat